MDNRYHILITSDTDKTQHFSVSKRAVAISGLVCSLAVSILFLASISTCFLLTKNTTLERKIADLQEKVERSDQLITEYQQQAEKEKAQLDHQLASLQMDKEKQTAAFKAEKESVINSAVSELRTRSELIERIMTKVGIKIGSTPAGRGKSNSGGPFIAKGSPAHDALLDKTDAYLKAIGFVPLGNPTHSGEIVSEFGSRQDPLNGKDSFHAGIDLSGDSGEAVYATAAGVVSKAFWNGSYGNYLEIDHRNGYSTCFAHLQKYIPTVGSTIQQGQMVGYIGSTGRTTGPHLHYEVHYQGKPIDPTKLTQVADLIQPDKNNTK